MGVNRKIQNYPRRIHQGNTVAYLYYKVETKCSFIMP